MARSPAESCRLGPPVFPCAATLEGRAAAEMGMKKREMGGAVVEVCAYASADTAPLGSQEAMTLSM